MSDNILLVTSDLQLYNCIEKILSKIGINLIYQDYTFLHKNSKVFNIVLLDIRETCLNTNKCIDFIKTNSKTTVIVINTLENITKSILAMKSGAKDEVLIPIDIKHFTTKIKKYLNKRQDIIKRIVSLKDNFINTMVNVTLAEENLIIDKKFKLNLLNENNNITVTK